MAIGVDTSKWKPRQLRGTPANRTGTIWGLVGVACATVACLYFQFSDGRAGVRKAFENFYEDPIEEIERRKIIAAGLPIRTGDKIRWLKQQEERPDLPYK